MTMKGDPAPQVMMDILDCLVLAVQNPASNLVYTYKINANSTCTIENYFDSNATQTELSTFLIYFEG
jgi:hypothetical protein